MEEPIINRKLIATTLLSALIIVTGTLWIFWRELSFDGKVTPRFAATLILIIRIIRLYFRCCICRMCFKQTDLSTMSGIIKRDIISIAGNFPNVSVNYSFHFP